jgi:hypothetical protein
MNMTGCTGTGFFAGMFDLDAVAQHCIAQADARRDIYFRTFWTNFLMW